MIGMYWYENVLFAGGPGFSGLVSCGKVCSHHAGAASDVAVLCFMGMRPARGSTARWQYVKGIGKRGRLNDWWCGGFVCRRCVPLHLAADVLVVL